MGENDENAPLFFSSEYKFGIDSKRRIQVPAKWRGVSSGGTYTLLVWRKKAGHGACLLALPPAAMKQDPCATVLPAGGIRVVIPIKVGLYLCVAVVYSDCTVQVHVELRHYVPAQ